MGYEDEDTRRKNGHRLGRFWLRDVDEPRTLLRTIPWNMNGKAWTPTASTRSETSQWTLQAISRVFQEWDH